MTIVQAKDFAKAVVIWVITVTNVIKFVPKTAENVTETLTQQINATGVNRDIIVTSVTKHVP